MAEQLVAGSLNPQTVRKGVTILGATGSIGVSTIDVVCRHPDRFEVVAITANQNVDTLFEQIRQLRPPYAVMRDAGAAARLREKVRAEGWQTEILEGESGLCEVAALDGVDYVMAAIVGAAGLVPTMAAVHAGKRILLANKEALVMSGALFMDAVQHSGSELLPIDSEHNAIFQCLPPNHGGSLASIGVARILLTGSGGPFRETPLSELAGVSPDQACAHPNWSMGRKISVDSATMMNKGLEYIEACWLFNAGVNDVKIVVHPQSVVHSMVEYVDGSVIAQLGHPDMRTPIAYGLGWPDRIESGIPLLDLVSQGQLNFEAPDEQRFPCLRLAKQAMETGQTASVVLNAANEVAVEAFLEERIAFTEITHVIENTLNKANLVKPDHLDVVIDSDRAARELAQQFVAQRINNGRT
ncbi:MAG: 1-deoxy-D-xylulose-5-phosphate reductoisomerase [Ketobacteraceae bacterium]|nr:1-deoxy-D-xylulose-5-phosphate reductoisomerase [Ketobacteraceae bacterium]